MALIHLAPWPLIGLMEVNECEVEDWESYDRPESQGGAWILAQRIKFNRIISAQEVEDILAGKEVA